MATSSKASQRSRTARTRDSSKTDPLCCRLVAVTTVDWLMPHKCRHWTQHYIRSVRSDTLPIRGSSDYTGETIAPENRGKMPVQDGGLKPDYTLKIRSLLIQSWPPGPRTHWFQLCWFNCLPGSNRRANGGKGFVAPRPRSNLYRGGALAAMGALDLGTIQENKLAL